MLPCPGCKQPTNPGAQFCPNCGYPLRKPETGKLLTGLPWVDGFIGFLLFWMFPICVTYAIPLVGDTVGSLIGLGGFIGLPIVLGLGLRYRAMAFGYLIGLGVLVALILGLLLICGIMIGAGGFH